MTSHGFEAMENVSDISHDFEAMNNVCDSLCENDANLRQTKWRPFFKFLSP